MRSFFFQIVMPPKKRRQGNNKENLPTPQFESFSIQTIIVSTNLPFFVRTLCHIKRLFFLGEKCRRIRAMLSGRISSI